jgi:hypothetical protein
MLRKTTKNLDLYTDNHPETTLKNTGFKNKKSANNTLKLIKQRSLKYQFDVVNTMYNRAKYHKYITNDMKSAMKIFKKWLDKYKNKKSLENINYPWLDYNQIIKYENLFQTYKFEIFPIIFFNVLKKLNGSYYKLQYKLIDINDPSYYDFWSYRIKIIQKLKKSNKKLFKYDGSNKIPTKYHLNMIMFGYSPTPELL